jgi:hypothetical protein
MYANKFVVLAMLALDDRKPYDFPFFMQWENG